MAEILEDYKEVIVMTGLLLVTIGIIIFLIFSEGNPVHDAIVNVVNWVLANAGKIRAIRA